MNKIRVNLANCYGIKQLNHEFKFKDGKPCSVYAPNGFMKTSFAKTFIDLRKGNNSKDLIFPENSTTREITDQGGADLESENVFVIEPYVESYKAESTSTLLVNAELKESYEEAVNDINNHFQILQKKLKQTSGLTGRSADPVNEMMKKFSDFI